MSSFYNHTITWSSPIIEYGNVWTNGLTAGSGTLAYPFAAEIVKIIGTGSRDSFEVELDGVVQPDALSRPVGAGDWPAGPQGCATLGFEGDCLVLAEFDGLDPQQLHNIQLHTTGNGPVQLVAVTIAADTEVPDFNLKSQTEDSTSTAVVWEGNWVDEVIDGQTYKVSQSAGDTATLNFQAFGLTVFGPGTGSSPYKVSLDGQEQTYGWTFTGDDQGKLTNLYQAIGLDQSQKHVVILTNTGSQKLAVGMIIADVVEELPLTGQTQSNNTTTGTRPDDSASSRSSPLGGVAVILGMTSLALAMIGYL